MTYRIRNWPDLYENNRTKDMKFMAWVPIPNRQDSDGYTCLVDRKNGAALFGAWIAIIQVASRCAPRGTLLREGAEPHDSTSLSRMTRMPKDIIQEMLAVCTKECKWLEIIGTQEGAENPQEGATIPHPTDEERNGTELNRTERKISLGVRSEDQEVLEQSINKWFNRRLCTLWSERELKALVSVVNLKTTPEDLAILEEYYLSNAKYKRKDILTLLNNWNGEIDRAKDWKNNPPLSLPAQDARKGENPTNRRIFLENRRKALLGAIEALRAKGSYEQERTDQWRADMKANKEMLAKVDQELNSLI